jgi:nicotinamidase-related amidase
VLPARAEQLPVKEFAPFARPAMHLAIDMQRLFAEPTDWFVPWLPKVLPNVLRIAEHHPDRTIFTRFMPPNTPDEMTGAWRDYYARWQSMTRSRIDLALLDLVEPLRKLSPPARILDKGLYSAFSHPRLAQGLRRRGIETLIITGGETDVCVMATVAAALDLGFRVVLPTDALCSANDTAHDALITVYRERFKVQLATVTTKEVLAEWR